MAVLESFQYQVLGKKGGPRVVFLHGLMGSGNNWRKITSALQQEYEILIFDQRGHGRSFHPKDSYQPEDYARDLEQILDELDWKTILLVGHSMGGRNALVFASQFPHRVNALVLVDISPEADERAVERIEFLLNLVPVPFESKEKAKVFFEEEFPRRLKGSSSARDLARYFYTNIEEKPDGSANWRFDLKGIRESLHSGRAKDRWSELEGLQVPTLVIRGGNSGDLSQKTYEKMLQCHPLMEGRVIEGAGHWVHFDQSEKFTESLRAFFDAHSS